MGRHHQTGQHHGGLIDAIVVPSGVLLRLGAKGLSLPAGACLSVLDEPGGSSRPCSGFRERSLLTTDHAKTRLRLKMTAH